jgi:hypothetical protein
MRATRPLVAALALAAVVETARAQIVSPPEIRDQQMRALQQKHLLELKGVAERIKAHSFPYHFYFSRTIDLSEPQQERSDQRSIRFEKYQAQTVLEITGNYYASYSAELMKKEERARRTLEDVMVPMIEAAVPALDEEEQFQGFALEISHHVRKRVLGVSTENAENVMFILPRDAARRVVAAANPGNRDAALRQGSLFVDGQAVEGWAPANALAASESQLDHHAADRPAAPITIATLSNTSAGPEGVLPPAPPIAAEVPQSTASTVATERSEEVTPERLRQQQSANQEILDRLVRELEKEAHFISYAPPRFIAFHNGSYLQLSITSTLRKNQAGSQYRVAALAFDEHIAHLIRPVLARFQQRVEFDGIDFSTSVRLAETADAGSAEAVEFIFPLSWLRAYEQYDCTGQQLINQAFVLINGERVTLDLQSAEARLNRD